MTTAGRLPDSDIWFVRAGRGNRIARFCLEQNLVAIGWSDVGPIQATDSSADIKQRFEKIYPGAWESAIKKFFVEMEIGDAVATYNSERRLYHIGIVRSPAEWNMLVADGEDLNERGYIRRVEWVGHISRDALTKPSRNQLGRRGVTIFRLSPETSIELREHCLGKPPHSSQSDIDPTPIDGTDAEDVLDTRDILQEYIAQSDQMVEDQIARLDWQQLQELVAGILRAMGYRTKVSSPGPDRGVDIFASPDGLGLAEPRIFVEVKHRKGTMGAPDIRSFLGGRRPGDRCLYVSTGGYTADARGEAARSQIPLTLLAMPDLRELLVSYYELLDTETRALVPLKKVYWPVAG